LTATGPGGVDVETHDVVIPASPPSPVLFINFYQLLPPGFTTLGYFNPALGHTLRINQSITFNETNGSDRNSDATTYSWAVYSGNQVTPPVTPPLASGTGDTLAWTPTSLGAHTVFMTGTTDCATLTIRQSFSVTATGSGGTTG